MDLSKLPFVPNKGVRELVTDIEKKSRKTILLREAQFNNFDDLASVQGGFDRWTPHVTVNTLRKAEFDEHGLVHELLHIKRFLEGSPSLETPEFVAGVRNDDAANRKAFASDVTNQIEHIAIFPELERFGFRPHGQADTWKVNQIQALERPQERPPGSLAEAWLAFKIGVAPFLGRSEEVGLKFREVVGALLPSAVVQGDEVSALIERFGVLKPYNLRRLYQLMLRAIHVPKGALLLKEFLFQTETETLTPIP